MTASVLAGVALALVASVALNGSFFMQHAGSHGGPPVTPRRPIASVRGLLASRLWLAGAAAGLAGWALHVAALSQAPLSLVQAFSAGGLALAVPVAARITRVPLAASERRAVLLMVGALVLLALGAGPAGAGIAAAAAMAAFLVVGAAVAAAFAATPAAGGRRAHGLGVAAGVLYGAADAATKAVTGAFHAGGLLAAVLSPWTLVVVAASAGAFFCFQRGLQIGPPVPVIVVMTAATNLVAVAGGLIVFAEPLGASAVASALHVLAFGVVGAAAWRLSRAQARLVSAHA